jgi:hypothetical protein
MLGVIIVGLKARKKEINTKIFLMIPTNPLFKVVWLPEIRVFENVLVFFFLFHLKNIKYIYFIYIYIFNKLA